MTEIRQQETSEILEKEEVEKIESAPFSIEDKINLLLVKAGVKPASEISALNNPELIQEIKSLFTNLGLVGDIEESKIDKRIVDILISQNQANLENLETARRNQSDFARGIALGYPATAVADYFNEKPGIMRWSLPQYIKEEKYYPFIRFRLSRDNWEEEITTAKKWANAVKTNSPKLLEDFNDETRVADRKFSDTNN